MSDPYTGIGAADPYDGLGAEVNSRDEREPSDLLGFWRGFTRPIDTAAEKLEAGLGRLGVDTAAINEALDLPSASEANRNRARAFMAAPKRPGELGKFVGSAVATIPLSRFGATAGGAATGYLTSESDDERGRLTDAAFGGIGGKVADVALKKLADAVTPVIRPAASRLAQRGVRLTPGQVRGAAAAAREDKLLSLPRVGEQIATDRARSLSDANRAFVDQALEPLGKRVPAGVEAGFDAVDYAQRAVGDAYESVVPNLSAKIDPRFVAGMHRLSRDLSMLPDPQQAQFQSVLKTMRFGPSGSLSGKALQNTLSDLGRLQHTYSTSAVASERELGKVLGSFRDELTGLVTRQNLADAPKLRAANDAFRRLAIVENAASRADDGIASTAQMRLAARAADATRRKAATAGGRGPMQDFVRDVRAVIPSKIPDSGTAGRMMAGRLIPEVRGAAAKARYRIDSALTQALAKAPPKTVARARAGLLALTAPVRTAGAVLLPGLLDD